MSDTELQSDDYPMLMGRVIPSFIKLYQFRHDIRSPPSTYTSQPFALEQDMIEAAICYAEARHTQNWTKKHFDRKLLRWNLSRGILYQQSEVRHGSTYDTHAEYSVITTVARADLTKCAWLGDTRLPVTLRASDIGIERR